MQQCNYIINPKFIVDTHKIKILFLWLLNKLTLLTEEMKTIELAKNLYCTKNEVFHSLVYENKSLCFFTFTKDVLNGKLHFLCSISYLDKGLLSFFWKSATSMNISGLQLH